jgi:hypothetical protein
MNLEEAEGKALAWRAGSGYEAARRGKAAIIVKARNYAQNTMTYI